MENNELYHFGINGQKWGIRRYQNEDGSRTPEGRIHYGYKNISPSGEIVKDRREIRIEKREARKAAREAKRVAKEEKKRAEFEKKKEEAVRSGSIEDVMKYSKYLTNDEKRVAIERLRYDSQLSEMASKHLDAKSKLAEQNSKWNKLKKVTKRIGETGTMIDDVTKAYNSAAKVINTFSDEPLTLIGDKSQKKTRSMQLADQLAKEYSDYSYEEWKLMPESKVNYLDSMNEKISLLNKTEKLRSGQSGKKK